MTDTAWCQRCELKYSKLISSAKTRCHQPLLNLLRPSSPLFIILVMFSYFPKVMTNNMRTNLVTLKSLDSRDVSLLSYVKQTHKIKRI